MAMLATLAALVLGLLTASAKSSLDDKENAVRSWAAEALFLDRTLAQYGPEAHGARELLKQAIAARIAQLWPGSGEAVTPAKIGEGAGIEGVQQALLALTPKTDAQRWLQSTALQTTSHHRRAPLADCAADCQQSPLAVPGCSYLLACCHLRELRPVRAAQYDRGSRSLRRCAFSRRLDLSHPRDGPALWRVHQDQKRSAAFGPGAARPALRDVRR